MRLVQVESDVECNGNDQAHIRSSERTTLLVSPFRDRVMQSKISRILITSVLFIFGLYASHVSYSSRSEGVPKSENAMNKDGIVLKEDLVFNVSEPNGDLLVEHKVDALPSTSSEASASTVRRAATTTKDHNHRTSESPLHSSSRGHQSQVTTTSHSVVSKVHKQHELFEGRAVRKNSNRSSPAPGSCSAKGENCFGTACCSHPGETCVSGGYRQGVSAGYMRCKPKRNQSKSEVSWLRRTQPKIDYRTWQAHGGVRCHSRFVAPPMPAFATQHNGVALPATCFNGTGKHHVFLISDWGGVLPGHKGNEGSNGHHHIAPADHTGFGGGRKFRKGTDEWAQFRVAKQIKKFAKEYDPDYFLQAGNAFNQGGIETKCGAPLSMYANTSQTNAIFEDVYKGTGVDGKQWLGVLGNHDYGGWMYIGAWDQVIGYTWGGFGSTGRWMLPALYWSAKVYYDDFAVDYYFVDSNVFDADGHNLCNMQKVTQSKNQSCGHGGPKSPQDCPKWFKKLWADQKDWLWASLSKSSAHWQIVVTHYPPTWGKEQWQVLARDRGIDLMVTGHKHVQEVHTPDDPLGIYEGWGNLYTDFMDGTSWIVAGGGGGVTSQGPPDGEGKDDQYGFMILTLSRFEIQVLSISHGGQVRSKKVVRPRPPAAATPNFIGYLSPAQLKLEEPAKEGCGTKKFTFYLYRAAGVQIFKDENINAANLAGVLWYLHHEVVMVCPRKFGITRIRRLKVTMRNTCDLFKERKTQFGPYTAFDSGRCGVEGCLDNFKKFGSVVGCQHIPYNTGVFAPYCEAPGCGPAQWYSFPGPCPSKDFKHKTEECKKDDPGGFCEAVTGERHCTYKFEDAGEVYLDELYKTVSQWYPWDQFCKSQIEYNNQTDYGFGVSWWDEIYNTSRCRDRYNAVVDRFKEKYPHMPATLPEPRCDNYESDPKGKYLWWTGTGFNRNSHTRKMR